MFWEADLRRGAYDPETLSMLSTVLERVVAALPHGNRTDERKARLASSILGAAVVLLSWSKKAFCTRVAKLMTTAILSSPV